MRRAAAAALVATALVVAPLATTASADTPDDRPTARMGWNWG